MTDALVTWLSRALDHAEEVARAAQTTSGRRYWRSGVWEVDPGDATAGDCVYDVNTDGGPGEAATPQEAAHIALHDPRAVLARVEAEKRLVADLVEAGDGALERLVDKHLRVLAYGHRHDFPGWREEWAPEGVTA